MTILLYFSMLTILKIQLCKIEVLYIITVIYTYNPLKQLPQLWTLSSCEIKIKVIEI